MKTIKFCLLLIAAISFGSLHAQTVEDIISKHVEAMGGKDKLAQLKAVHMDMNMEVMGNEAASNVTIVEGKGYKYESDFNGQKIVQCYTDKGGWTINPMMGSSDPQPLPEDQYKMVKDQIYITDPLYDYASKGNKVELQGQEKIGDADAYKIKVSNDTDTGTVYYLDPSTYYIVQIVKNGEMMGNPVTITVKNSNFQKTDDGYVFPHTLQTSFGDQFSLTAKVTKVDINPTVDPSIFEMPK